MTTTTKKISNANDLIMKQITLTADDALYIFEQTQWGIYDSRQALEIRLDNIRDMLRADLHDAGIRFDESIAENDAEAS